MENNLGDGYSKWMTSLFPVMWSFAKTTTRS